MKDVGDQMLECPCGLSHARQAGSALAACGRYAVGWRIFWELPFQMSAHHACPARVEAVAVLARRNGHTPVLTLVTNVEDETHLRGTRTRCAHQG